MIRFSTSVVSSLGKKIFMGITGLMLSGFIVVHLVGNLALLSPDRDPFNKYAHFLLNLGTALYLAEIALAAIFIIHFIYAIIITIGNWRARPNGYKMVTNAGHTSKKSWASTTMIYTGALIITFTILHLLHFKYGEIFMYTTADGHHIRDLFETVYRYFSNIWNMIFYVIVIILLGYHLSHGFWSAFQSLGLDGERFTPFTQILGYIFAIVMAIGFILMPVWIHLDVYNIFGGAQ
ncbi:MAG: succinate dehydrogenase cytochrome b subunit [Calditrichia bacterium]